MTALISGSLAAIKQLAPDGVPDVGPVKTSPLWDMTTKSSSFPGNPWRLALCNEGTQGASAGFTDALSALKQSSLVQFTIQNSTAEPYTYYSLARIKGSALRTVKNNAAGVVDLWQHELESATRTCKTRLAIHQWGDGSGEIGRLGTGSVASTSVTLATIQDISRFAVGMKIQFTSDHSTLRGAGAAAEITGIDRAAGTLTFSANLNTLVLGVAASDYIVPAGDLNAVIQGVQSWIPGSATPGTLYGLNRNVDPVRLSGNYYAGTGVPMTEAMMQLSALIESDGNEGNLFITNVRKLARLKMLLEGKVQYTRTSVPTKTAGIAFEAMEFEGSNGKVRVIGDRYAPYTKGYSLSWDKAEYKSPGAIVQVLSDDSNDILRVANDDAYEVRVGSTHLFGLPNPGDQGVITGFGE